MNEDKPINTDQTDSLVDATNASSGAGAKRHKKDKLTLLAILAVFILPFFVLPLLMSPEQRDKTNKGHFVQPHVAFTEANLNQLNGDIFELSRLEGKWVLLYFLPTDCDDACRHALFAMRQVRKALDRDVDRVRQLVVHTSNASDDVSALLASEFSGMLQLTAQRGEINTLFATSLNGDSATEQGYIYLMSPDGYVFMYYPSYADEQESVLRARDIRKDLKKSMKGSLIG